MDFKKMMEEEKALEEQMYGTEGTEDDPGKTADPPAEPTELAVPDFQVEPVVVEPTQQEEEKEPVEPVEPPQEKKKRVSWKQRHINFKAVTDNTIRELRLENAELRNQLSSLTQVNHALEVEIAEFKAEQNKKKVEKEYDDTFTAEDVDILGPEAIAIMKRAMKAKAQPTGEVDAIKEQLREMRELEAKREERELKKLRAEDTILMKQRLTSAVPDWEAIDATAEFAAYMIDADPLSGVTRKTLLERSVAAKDIGRIAQFYLDFKSLRPATKEEILGDQITPTGAPGTSNHEGTAQPGQKPTYHITEYEEFMNDVAKGRYAHKRDEMIKIEARYDRAFMDGRIVE